jgi:benzoyl-CoA reductase subunit D
VVSAGIDVGSQSIKAVIVRDGQIVGRGHLAAAFDAAAAARQALEEALAQAGMVVADVRRLGATGIGRDEVAGCHARLSEVSCAARGAQRLLPAARTVIDVGAEQGTAVRCDGRGRVLDFAINEKCAAGAGAFCEAIARALEVGLDELGPLALQSTRLVPMNLQCVVFAESEVVSMIHSNVPKPDIARAVHVALAARVVGMVRRVGIEPEVALVGGLARNVAFVAALRQALGVDPQVPADPELCGAFGAALAAEETP